MHIPIRRRSADAQHHLLIPALIGETGRISVTGAISVTVVFFFIKIIILCAQIKFLVQMTAKKTQSELVKTRC